MHKLNQVIIEGGHDCPEMGITGVIQALKVVKPNSYIYLFTDSSPKDTHLTKEAFELIQKKQSQVIETIIIVYIFNHFTNNQA